jgi:hypothetical protein
MLGRDALLVERVEPVDVVFFLADFESGAAVETVQRHDGLPRDAACTHARLTAIPKLIV